MLTFFQVLKRKYVFDASGIDNPHEWLWDRDYNINIYYPTKKI